jgi:hypothetical protein
MKKYRISESISGDTLISYADNPKEALFNWIEEYFNERQINLSTGEYAFDFEVTELQ